MTSALVAFLLALVKAIPAAAAILDQVSEGYRTWRTQQNATDEADKNARNAALIAGESASPPRLCASCPFAPTGGGQHGEIVPAPGVPPRSPSGS